jgi:outer membrane protein assembly factor BamB
MKRMLRTLLAALLIVTSSNSLLLALKPGDWPQWRGPDRDGHAIGKNLLTDWEKSPPKLLWRIDGMGQGYSSVAVADGFVYVLGNDNSAQNVLAIDESGKSIAWKTPITETVPQHYAKGSRCTPSIDGDYLYAISSNGGIACLKRNDGSIVWQKDFKQEWNGRMMSVWGFSESPLVDGDLVLCTPGGEDAEVVALNKLTGDEVWRCPDPGGPKGNVGAGYASIVISHAAGVKQYVQLVGRGVIGIRATDGKLLWSYNRIANGTGNIPDPLCFDDYVFCSTGYGTGAALLKITGTGSNLKAEEQYFLDSKTFQNHHGGMIRVGDYIYAGHGHGQGFPICIEWKTGKVAWRNDVRAKDRSGSAAVAYADGHLIFRYESGNVMIFEANPKEFRPTGNFRPDYVQNPSWSHPVVADGKLYLREQNVLMCYDLSR